MTNDSLATYVQDHLAGAASAIELLEMLDPWECRG
jgi:hypothetical protein